MLKATLRVDNPNFNGMVVDIVAQHENPEYNVGIVNFRLDGRLVNMAYNMLNIEAFVVTLHENTHVTIYSGIDDNVYPTQLDAMNAADLVADQFKGSTARVYMVGEETPRYWVSKV